MASKVEVIGMPDGFLERAHTLVADRDPIEILSATPAKLRAIIEANATDHLRARPFADKWSPLEIIGHLVDHEVETGLRLRRILTDPEPVIDSYRQEAWVEALSHNTREPGEFLAAFDVLRAESLRMWRMLGDVEDRQVTHVRRGPMSLQTFAIMNAGHDLSHLGQIERYLAAMR